MSNLKYKSYLNIIDQRLKGIYEKSFQRNRFILKSLLDEKDEYSSISSDEYRICFLFQIYVRRILFERKTHSLISHHKKWNENLEGFKSKKKSEIIKTYQAKITPHLRNMANRYNLSFNADDIFTEQLLFDILYPIQVESNKLTDRLRIIKKIQAGELSQWDFFREFTFLETFQEYLIESNYLKILQEELDFSGTKVKTTNYDEEIFLDQEAFQLFQKVIENKHTFMCKTGPAFYSKIFHLFVDENLIYSKASKTDYCKMITDIFKIPFKQFDIRTMYGENEINGLSKLKNA